MILFETNGLLIDALVAGDLSDVDAHVETMLDDGDMAGLNALIVFADRCLPREAADHLEEAVERQCQSVVLNGFSGMLICVPILADTSLADELPVEPLQEILASMAHDGEQLIVANGWVHIRDLMALDMVGYRKVAKILSAGMAFDKRVVGLPADMFPRFPARSEDTSGGAEIHGYDDDMKKSVVRINARFLFGFVRREARGEAAAGSLTALAEGRMSDAEQAVMRDRLEARIPGFRALLVPGQPIGAAVEAAACIDTMVLEARLDAVVTLLGKKPVTHFCLDGETLHLVMTRNGADVVDSLTLCAVGMAHDTVSAIIDQRSRGFVVYDTPAELPRAVNVSVH